MLIPSICPLVDPLVNFYLNTKTNPAYLGFTKPKISPLIIVSDKLMARMFLSVIISEIDILFPPFRPLTAGL